MVLGDLDFDKYLLKWFLDQIQNGIAVTSQVLRLQAQRMNEDPSFKASTGWYENGKDDMVYHPAARHLSPKDCLRTLKLRSPTSTIPDSIVRKSFLKTGITNGLDGTQDDEIAEEDQVTRMEVTQEEFDDIFDPDGDDEEFGEFGDNLGFYEEVWKSQGNKSANFK